jgi:hypothetical protein
MKKLSQSQFKWLIFLFLSLFAPIYFLLIFVDGFILSPSFLLLWLVVVLTENSGNPQFSIFIVAHLIFYSILNYNIARILSKLLFKLESVKTRLFFLVMFSFILILISFAPVYSSEANGNSNLWKIFLELAKK